MPNFGHFLSPEIIAILGDLSEVAAAVFVGWRWCHRMLGDPKSEPNRCLVGNSSHPRQNHRPVTRGLVLN
jgi:hypothetical protein